jgi:outer membrane protein OmpA-like peptidoglycan-associated protein
MKIFKILGTSVLVLGLLISSGCSSMSNLAKGTLIGTGTGSALGAGIGALIGSGKGAAIGAGVGAAVGAGVGALIGNKMDKQKKELEEQLANTATVDTVTVNNLTAIKVTFPGGILFPTNGTTLSTSAKTALNEFAQSVNTNTGTDIHIYGFTDNTGTLAANTKVADGRATSVYNHLLNQSVSSSRMEYKGVPMDYYIADNSTADGRSQNRRVEIYITANEEMISAAENGTLK